MNIREAIHLTRTGLEALYSREEATAMTYILLSWITGMQRLHLMTEGGRELTETDRETLAGCLDRLRQGEPIQHITQQQFFDGLELFVNNQVLIPRPETEELVQWIAADKAGAPSFEVLDIGTGSGCIALALKKRFPAATVSAMDKSGDALQVARQNARQHGLEIGFFQGDLFVPESMPLERYDLLVSNPPYIPLSEKQTLERQVEAYEPALALFVEDGDPLIYYRAIAGYGRLALRASGAVYCETHRDYTAAVAEVFQQTGFRKTEIRKDISGNPRMVKAIL